MPDARRVEIVRNVWDAVARSDVAALEALCQDDVVWHASGRGPRSGDYRGGAVLDYLAGIGDDTERFDLELQDVLLGADLTAAIFQASGHRKGRDLETGFILLFRFAGDQIAEVWAIPRDQHEVDEFWS